MAQNFVTKKTVVKNIARRTPAINYLSEKLTALGILIVFTLLIYWFWPESSTSGELASTYNKQLENGDFRGAYQTIEKTRKNGADTTFLSEGEAQKLIDVIDIMNQNPE